MSPNPQPYYLDRRQSAVHLGHLGAADSCPKYGFGTGFLFGGMAVLAFVMFTGKR